MSFQSFLLIVEQELALKVELLLQDLLLGCLLLPDVHHLPVEQLGGEPSISVASVYIQSLIALMARNLIFTPDQSCWGAWSCWPSAAMAASVEMEAGGPVSPPGPAPFICNTA